MEDSIKEEIGILLLGIIFTIMGLLIFSKQKSMRDRSMMAVATMLTVAIQGCAYTEPGKSIDRDSQVGGTGNIGFTHERLAANKHMVTVTASPGVMETEGSIAQRIHNFANRFAAKACEKSFSFVHDPNLDQSIAMGFMKRTKTYVFSCEQ